MLLTLAKHERCDYLCNYVLSLSMTEEEVRLFFQARASSALPVEEDRAVGALMGMAIGDALERPSSFCLIFREECPHLRRGWSCRLWVRRATPFR